MADVPLTSTSQLAAEIAAGHGLSLAQAARRFPASRLDRPVSPSCVWRWVADGVVTADGRRLRLEAVRLAGRWLTTVQAIERWVAAQAAPASGGNAVALSESDGPAQRAGEALRQFGI